MDAASWRVFDSCAPVGANGRGDSRAASRVRIVSRGPSRPDPGAGRWGGPRPARQRAASDGTPTRARVSAGAGEQCVGCRVASVRSSAVCPAVDRDG
eukprot:200765-Prymnesium_polylepis.1